MNISRKDAKVKTRTQRGSRELSRSLRPFFVSLRLCVKPLLLALVVLSCSSLSFSQGKADKPGSHTTRGRPSMSVEAKALLEDAIGVVCTQAKLDPKSS